MGKKVYFLDSVKKSDGTYDNTYGVDDINSIVSNLVGAGVAPFPSNNTYDVSELNSLTNALVTAGTSLDGLKVIFSDNKIYIYQGIGYFENGATIVVDSDGEELDYNVAEILYVYAEYNQALNMCGFYTSETLPTSSTGIYVIILATIAADGTVTDKRHIAQSKIATMGRNECRSYTIVDKVDGYNNYYSSTGEEVIVWEEALDIRRFNLIQVKFQYSSAGSSLNGWGSDVDIEITNGGLATNTIYYRSKSSSLSYQLMIRDRDGKLQIYVPAWTSSPVYECNIYSLYLNIY